MASRTIITVAWSPSRTESRIGVLSLLSSRPALAVVLASVTFAGTGAGRRSQAPASATANVIEAVGTTVRLTVVAGRSKLLRAPRNPPRGYRRRRHRRGRPDFTRELMILGKAVGKTDLTVWASGEARPPVVIVVRVVSK